MSVTRLLAALALGSAGLLLAPGAGAQGTADEEVPPPVEALDPVQAPSFRWTRVRLNGRLVGRWHTVRQDDVSESELDLENARLTLHWRPARWLRGQLEYDAGMNRKLKDAFLRLRSEKLSLRGGQFKPPFSAMAMDSRWDLPVSERGQLDRVLRDSMGVVGRRAGLQGGYQPRGGDTRAFVGVFRASSVRGDRIGDESFNNPASDWAPKLTGRVQHSRGRLDLGFSGDWRPAEPLPGEGYQRFWTASADVRWIQRRTRGGWRVWAESYVGSSWQDSDPFDGAHSTFVAGQVIGAWRYGGRKQHAFYVEPYTLVSILDPDTSGRDDVLWEAVGGVNVGRWDQVRVTIELQHHQVAPNTPESLGLFFVHEPPYSRNTLVLQLGGAF